MCAWNPRLSSQCWCWFDAGYVVFSSAHTGILRMESFVRLWPGTIAALGATGVA